jgi:hypothetical protein
MQKINRYGFLGVLIMSITYIPLMQGMKWPTPAGSAAGCKQPFIPKPIWAVVLPSKPDQQWWRQGPVIAPRKEFIRDLIGMSEETFRKKSRWTLDNTFDPTRVAQW